MKMGIYLWHPKNEKRYCIGEWGPNGKRYENKTDEEAALFRIKEEINPKDGTEKYNLSDIVIDYYKVLDFLNRGDKDDCFDKLIHANIISYFGKSSQVATEIFELDDHWKNPKDIFISAIEKTAADEWSTFDPERPFNFPLRKDSQDIAVEKIKLCHNSGFTKFLLGAKCRFGKTFTSYEAAVEIGADTILIMTFRPNDTREEWRSDLNSHQDFKDYTFYTVKNLEAFKKDTGKKVLFVSFQKITQALSKDNYELLNFLESVKFDLLVVDEDHIGAHRQENRCLMSKINPKFILAVTGTPELEIISNEFEDNYYKFDYIDEQRLKEKYHMTGDVLYKDYGAMPKLSVYSINLTEKFKDTIITDKNGFQLSEFFKVKDDGTFEHTAYIKKFLDNLSMTCDNAEIDLDEAFAIFVSDRNLDHGLWKLPSVKACKALKELLNSHVFFKNYYVEVLPESDLLPDKIEKICKENQKTIWLTVVKNTVGVTVKPWTYTMSLYGSESSSLSTYIQYIFRAGSPGKKEFYSFDFCPSRVLKLADDFAQAHASSSTKESYDSALRQVLNYLPVYVYNQAGIWSKLDNNELFKQIANFTTIKSCHNLLLEEFSELTEYSNEVASVKCDKLNPQITKNEALDKLRKEFKEKNKRKNNKKKDDENKLSDKDFAEKAYQAFIDIYSWTKYYFGRVDNTEDLISKIKTWKNDYEKIFGFSKDFMEAMIALISVSQKKFGIAIERFANINFKFALEDVPEELTQRMFSKFSSKKEGETICDYCCKGPSLLLFAAKWNPTAKLYARIKDDDLKTELILKKELGDKVNIIKVESFIDEDQKNEI